MLPTPLMLKCAKKQHNTETSSAVMNTARMNETRLCTAEGPILSMKKRAAFGINGCFQYSVSFWQQRWVQKNTPAGDVTTALNCCYVSPLPFCNSAVGLCCPLQETLEQDSTCPYEWCVLPLVPLITSKLQFPNVHLYKAHF